MSQGTNRREFLKTSALAGAGFWIAGTQSAWAQSKSANEKLRVAGIGGGGKGHSDLAEFAKAGAEIVAICDVDHKEAAKAFKEHPNARKFFDFREMFDKMAKEIDAVSISTPDHTHAVATMMAMKLGKHVYTQKPLCRDAFEARELTRMAKESGLVTQMGNQGTSYDGLREAVEVVWADTIGPVREVHVWTNRPVWPQGANAIVNMPAVKYALHRDGTLEQSTPETLKWDLWLGTAPERPYPGANVIHPFKWRGFWDYGTGALGDMACHTANMAFMACRLAPVVGLSETLRYPTSVVAECSELNPETYPMWSVVRYEFPEGGGQPELLWTWYDGGADKPQWVNKKLKELAHGLKIADSGSLLIGEKMTLYSPDDYGAKYYLIPKEGKPIGPLPDAKKFQPPPQKLPRCGGQHYAEWVRACVAGKPEMCMSNFSYAGPLTETVVLGCVALRAGKKILWDGPNLKITNDEKANGLLRREYRKPWAL